MQGSTSSRWNGAAVQGHAASSVHDLPLSDMPLADRIQLTHALIEFLSLDSGIDLLHIKGYAADRSLYTCGRISTDVDVLVRPCQAERFVEVLVAKGWDVTTTFQSGSVFHHAMTLWNAQWGHVDVHRSFPGSGLDADAFFEFLWASREVHEIAGWPCRVPALEHQALVIVLHGARDPYRGQTDVRFVRNVLGPSGWARIELLARDVDARLSFAAATGRLDEWDGHPEHDIWDVVSRGGTRIELFCARWRASQRLSQRWALIGSAVVVNRDHLRMKLLREPKIVDYVGEVWLRIVDVAKAVWNWIRSKSENA